jgi:hypothetical protein
MKEAGKAIIEGESGTKAERDTIIPSPGPIALTGITIPLMKTRSFRCQKQAGIIAGAIAQIANITM